MKSIVLILSMFLVASCSTPTVDTSKPNSIPEWVRWGTYEHYAYNDGRMHFNEDSSIMLIVPIRAEYNETSTSLIGANVIINGE